jgi:hypothetical protein
MENNYTETCVLCSCHITGSNRLLRGMMSTGTQEAQLRIKVNSIHIQGATSW